MISSSLHVQAGQDDVSPATVTSSNTNAEETLFDTRLIKETKTADENTNVFEDLQRKNKEASAEETPSFATTLVNTSTQGLDVLHESQTNHMVQINGDTSTHSPPLPARTEVVATQVHVNDENNILPFAEEINVNSEAPLYKRKTVIFLLIILIPVIAVVAIGVPVLILSSLVDSEELKPQMEDDEKLKFVPPEVNVPSNFSTLALLNEYEEGIYQIMASISEGQERFFEDESTPYGKAWRWIVENDVDIMSQRLNNTFSMSQSDKGWKRCSADETQETCFSSKGLMAKRWLSTDTHECFWAGIGCQKNGMKVKFIHLDDYGLNGRIPTELGKLTSLGDLYLDTNNINGRIPSEIGLLSNLYRLLANDNNLNGEIPLELFSLPKLKFVALEDNELEGDLHSTIGNLSAAMYLSFERNELKGSIPSEIGKLENLGHLKLAENMFEGTIPTQIGNFGRLSVLNVSRNTHLGGNIPSEIGKIETLSRLNLHGCSLNGTIPSQFYNLSSLMFLDLSFNSLSGSINSNIGKMNQLKSILLNNNKFLSTIPEQISKLTVLEYGYFDNNDFVGNLDSAICNLKQNSLLELKFDCGKDNHSGLIEVSCECCTNCCNLISECYQVHGYDYNGS